MSKPHTDRVRGELLREWRVSQSCDVTALASRANLSVAQILQLESGGSSLFYTPAIKENAARKVASLLGGDPAAVIRPLGDEPVTNRPSVVEDLVELSRQRARAAQSPSVLSRLPRWWLGALLALGALLGGLAWLQSQVPRVDIRALWQASAARVTPAVKAEAPPVAALSAPAPAPIAVEKSINAGGLCQQGQPSAVLTPTSPSKAGDMVYIVPQKLGAICVVDGTGLRTELSLQPNDARSVYGSPPWRVHWEQVGQVQLYFQGVRLRLPDPGVTAVALQEAARAR